MNNIIKISCDQNFDFENNFIKSQEFTNEFMGMTLQRLVTTNMNLLESPECVRLKDYILNKMQGYELKGSWASRIDPGVGAGKHNHPDADVSGTICLTLNDGVIYHHIENTTREEILHPGDLIFWPSNMYHSVPINENSTEWYSVNFDLKKVL
jgi:quercetin dioxygenase-like cupin family protein